MTNSQARIASVIETSREELLDLGLRNPLLNYRPSRARGVEVVDELPAEVFRVLVRERKAMSFKAAPEETRNGSEEALWLAQPGDEDAQEGPAARHVDTQLQTNLGSAKLQSRLIKTERDARTFIEEQGVNILYLALGMLHWYESQTSQEQRRAPLILVPVALDRSNVRERFRLRYTDEELGDNLSLMSKLKLEYLWQAPVVFVSEQYCHSRRQDRIGQRPNAQRCDSDEENYASDQAPFHVPTPAQRQKPDGDLKRRYGEDEQRRSERDEVDEHPPVKRDIGARTQPYVGVGIDKDRNDVDPYGHDQEEDPQEDASRVGPKQAQDEHQRAEHRPNHQLLHYVFTSSLVAAPNLTRRRASVLTHVDQSRSQSVPSAVPPCRQRLTLAGYSP